MKNYWKLYLNGQAGYVVPVGSLEIIQEELKSLEPGDRFTITATQMTEKKFNSLPEFQGW